MENILLTVKQVTLLGVELFVIGMTGATLITLFSSLIRRWSAETTGSVQGTPSAVAPKSH